jgi:hypothetical protein
MLSDLRQMTENCEKRENLSLRRMEYVREVVLACNLPIMIRVIVIFAVNLSFGYSNVSDIILSLLIS